ncbi:MAG: phosphatidylglycerophosphatase A [Alphaproteobacteria bacterium]|nr:phosphatidylglycerophosphatase A [Alphaproteobacteria bacterium]
MSEKLQLDLKAPYVWLATWFGFGLLKPAPGTWGSLGSLPFGLLIFKFSGLIGLLAAIVLVSLVGYWAADRFEKNTGIHDCKMVVIDEVAGQWIALLPVFYFWGLNGLGVLSAFLLFRVFDILKPWPVSYFDKKIDNAIGVMGDDIVAGLYGALIITGVFYAGFG